jgi:hypothetical protein
MAFLRPFQHRASRICQICLLYLFWLLVVSGGAVADDQKPTLSIDDLYLLEGPRGAVLSADQQRLAYIRRWIDTDSREERFSLWLVEDDPENARPLEEGRT